MPVEWVTAYDKKTGRKIEHQVPRSYLTLYPHLTETPASKSRKKKAEPAPEADTTTTTAPMEEGQ